jgi:hypothetical protein
LQARVLLLLHGIQLGKDFLIAGRGKNYGALLCGDRRRVILESGQLIRQRNAADIGTDPVDRAHEVAGMEQRRHTGAAPRIGAAITGNHGEEHRLFAQRGNICRKNGNARMIYGEHQLCLPDAAYGISGFVSRSNCGRELWKSSFEQSIPGSSQCVGLCGQIEFYQAENFKILNLNLGKHIGQIFRQHKAAPAEKAQDIKVAGRKNHGSSHFPARHRNCACAGSGATTISVLLRDFCRLDRWVAVDAGFLPPTRRFKLRKSMELQAI